MAHPFTTLVALMAQLRAPDGCPWDRKQTHDSLKPYLLEETYEVLETIDRKDYKKLKEELGDLLLQVLFHAQIGTETGTFTIEDVLSGLGEKLIRRHPHLFTHSEEGSRSLNADEVYSKWEHIKREERRQAGDSTSALEGVPKTLPALLRAYQVQARASRVGFDWPATRKGREQVFGKIQEEIKELREILPSPPAQDTRPDSNNPSESQSRRLEDELGDILFSVVNLARSINVNPEDALRRATNRFTHRFQHIESEATRTGRQVQDLTLTEMDALWEEAKTLPSPTTPSQAESHDTSA